MTAKRLSIKIARVIGGSPLAYYDLPFRELLQWAEASAKE